MPLTYAVPMSWFILILIANNLFAISGLLDKFFCSKKFKNIYAFAVLSSLLQLVFIIGLSFFVSFPTIYSRAFILSAITGPVYLLMWILFWKVLATGEVSRASAIFQTAPIYNAVLAIIFLGESLSGIKWLAILLTVAGAVLCSWEGKGRGRFNRVYLLVVLAAVLGAVGNIISKFTLKQVEPLALYAIAFYASFPLYLLLLAKREVWQEVRTSLQRGRLVAALFARSLVAFSAVCLFYLALSRGPVSVVAAVGGITPLLTFIYSTIVSLLWPKFIKEEIGRRALFLKVVAIVLIVSGVIIINQ